MAGMKWGFTSKELAEPVVQGASAMCSEAACQVFDMCEVSVVADQVKLVGMRPGAEFVCLR